jgi:hypothetical protein
MLVSDNVLMATPSIGVSFQRHWKLSGGVPVAVTRNDTLAPKLTDWLRGCWAITGGVG